MHFFPPVRQIPPIVPTPSNPFGPSHSGGSPRKFEIAAENPPKNETDSKKKKSPKSTFLSADRSAAKMPAADPATALAPAPTPPPARGTAAGPRLLLLQSPPPAFPLGSNDDQLERARARAAARAASVRRRSLAASLAPRAAAQQQHDLLNRDQVMDLFHNCIKLASENVRAFYTLPPLVVVLPHRRAETLGPLARASY